MISKRRLLLLLTGITVLGLVIKIHNYQPSNTESSYSSDSSNKPRPGQTQFHRNLAKSSSFIVTITPTKPPTSAPKSTSLPSYFLATFPRKMTNTFREEQSLTSVAQRQVFRLGQLRNFCETEGKNMEPFKIPDWIRPITLMEQFNAYECRIPKTGTSSRAVILWPLYHESTEEDFLHPTNDKSVPKTKIEYITKNPERKKTMFGFVFVRNPFQRALSGYFDRVIRNGKHGGINTSFSDFLEMISSKKIQNEHFWPQTMSCQVCDLNITFLGRQETSDEDMDYIINYATNISQVVNFHHDKDSSSKTLKLVSPKYYKTVAETELNVLIEFMISYKNDYLAFGYDPYQDIEDFLEIKRSTI